MSSNLACSHPRNFIPAELQSNQIDQIKKKNQVPLLENIKVLSPSQDIAKKNSPRPFWYYLTLGIPIFFETLSIFFKDIAERKTMGDALLCRFRYKLLPEHQITQISQFHNYNELNDAILNKSELDKAIELAHQALATIEKAQHKNNEAKSMAELEKYHSIIALLQKNKNERLSRKNISEMDWKILDSIDYEVAKDHFSNLTNLFNSNWFKELRLTHSMKRHFNVNYPEAVIAESLSMSLSYIEGLDGKTISLPCRCSKNTTEYRSVQYTIKEFTLGDALPCYILESEDPEASPWFVVRGTQFYKDRTASFESILADSIDHKGIAMKIINKSLAHSPLVKQGILPSQKESLSDIFNQWRTANKQVILTGHSLGGTIVNTMAVDFPETLKAVYAFSAAGVAQKTELKYQQLPEQERDKIINFDFTGDVVPTGGHCLIGRHLAITSVAKERLATGFHEIHVSSHLNRDFIVQKVDTAKENGRFSRKFCEKIRVLTGRCLRFLLEIFGSKYLPDWWTKRKIYKKYANEQRKLNALSHLRKI